MSNIKRYIESIADQLACDTADCGTCLDCQTQQEMDEWYN